MAASLPPSLTEKTVPKFVTWEFQEEGGGDRLPSCLPTRASPQQAGSPAMRPQLLDPSFISWCREFPGAGPFLPVQPAPLSGRDRCEELAVGTNAVTGTGTKEEDRV